MIVTVTHTIMDGPVVSWYYDQTPLDAIPAHQAQVSASRNGVLVHGYLGTIGEDVLALARDVHSRLAASRGYDPRHLATHRRRGMFGPYEPVTAPAQPADASTEG